MQLYELCKFPKIFKNTYWGGFNAVLGDNKTAKLRDHFVNELKILSKTSSIFIDKITLPEFDHKELYRTYNGYVLVISPYFKINDKMIKKLKITAYTLIYGAGTYSYIKEFKTRKDINDYARSFFTEGDLDV